MPDVSEMAKRCSLSAMTIQRLQNIVNSNGNLTIYVNGTTDTWMYCTATNNGVRVGTNANKVLERNIALKTIWVDDNYFNARSMDVYITKLRKHLKEDPAVEIINVHGKGYKLVM